MSNAPINLFRDWLEAYVTTTGYSMSRGMWEEVNNSTKKFVAVWSMGGRTPNGPIQYASVRVVITGRANGRALGDTEATELFAQTLFDAAVEHYKTGCIMKIRPLGSMQGPYYTETNRPWVEINFELIC